MRFSQLDATCPIENLSLHAQLVDDAVENCMGNSQDAIPAFV